MKLKLKDKIKYCSTPGRIIMTLLTSISILIILQAIIIQLYWVSSPHPPRRSQPETKLTAEEANQERVNDADKEFLPDGTVHLVRTTGTGSSLSENDYEIEIYDTEHNLLWSGKAKDAPYNYLLWRDDYIYRQSYRRIYPREDLSVIGFNRAQTIEEFSRPLIVPVVAQDGTILQRWRYLPGGEIFAGMDLSGEKLGYFGANGPAKTKDQAQPLSAFQFLEAWSERSSLSPILLWRTEQKLYEIDFARQRIDQLFDAKGQAILSVNFNNWRRIFDERKDYQPALHIETENREHFLLFREPRRLVKLNLPEELHRDYLRIAAYRDNIFLMCSGEEGRLSSDNRKLYSQDRELWQKWADEYRYKAHRAWVQLFQIDEQGNLTSINRFEWIRPARKKSVGPVTLTRREKARNYVTAVSTPVFNWIWRYERKYASPLENLGYLDPLSSLHRDFLVTIREMYPRYTSLNWILGVMLVLPVLAHGWSRRTSWAALIFWLVFTAIFNLAGFLTYLALNHTPVVRCSVCGKRRGLEKNACCACKSDLPTPQSLPSDHILLRHPE